MRTNLTLFRTINLRHFFPILVIGLMLTIDSPARTEEKKPEIPLTVKAISDTLALNHTIKVKIENLEKWIDQPGNDHSKFILYIDGNALNGLTPTLTDSNKALQFDLKRTIKSKEAWTALLSRKPRKFTREVPVTVRQDGVKVGGEDIATLIVVNESWFWIFVVSFLGAIALFWGLAKKSDIIRVPGPQPTKTNDKGKIVKPYSLARTQMALWFFVVIISYVFIWMVTSDLSNLTPSVLGLIGISAATGLSAAIVGSSKRDDHANNLRACEEKKKNDEVKAEKLKSEIKTLSEAVAATPPPTNLSELNDELTKNKGDLTAKEKEIEHSKQKIQMLSAAIEPAVSKTFIKDILSDDGGISFHRFQIFTWTIVLILIFVASVYNVLSMPEFDATLLALMGISGGTYIGFKLPKQES